jgi:L-asparaginase/Glu-tRNA(Gln) amidotransferase subunit D
MELKRLGALSSMDMTVEASLMKMMYLLAKYPGDMQEVKRLFEVNIAGELSEREAQSFEEAEL